MTTIALIDPSPTARAYLAAGLRSEFTVLENGTLIPAIATTDTKLIVASAGSVTPGALAEPPFAALPCLILGSFPTTATKRPAPLVAVESPLNSAELLMHVRALLNTSHGLAVAAEDGPPRLRPPFHPLGLIAQVQRAARAHAAQLPILIFGERGTGKRTVARALHRIAEHGPLLRVTPLTATGLTDGRTTALLQESSTTPVTLLADGIDAFPGEAQSVLAACVAAGNLGPAGAARPFWLLATTKADLRALADTARFDSELASRLFEIVIEVPPLRSRPQDVSQIAHEIFGELGAMLRSPFSLAPEGAACLEHYQWPGNLAELLAVLRRTAVLTAGRLIGSQQIAFTSQRLESSAAPACLRDEGYLQASKTSETHSTGSVTSCPPAAPRETSSLVPQQLELILTELAHELKNPMVTIKTFAQHLPTLLEDAELRERFSVLTDDAISRMDSLLENLLDFARLGHPTPEPVALTILLDGILAGVGEKIEQRGARVRREGWDHAPCVLADEGHLSYALRNLFDSLASELQRHDELAVRVGDNGTIGLRFLGTGGVTAKLQGFLCDGPGVPAPAALPLRFKLARAVIARNGGQIAVDSGDSGETLVTVALPSCPGGAPDGGGNPGAATKAGGGDRCNGGT